MPSKVAEPLAARFRDFKPSVKAPPPVARVSSLIGGTPLLQLRRIVPPAAAKVWAKAEHLNPGGSVKDRIALAMIEAAERSGALQPGALIVEPTSGNTGISLAILARLRGYRLKLTMPASMSLERRALLKAYGAEIVLTEPEALMRGAQAAAERIVREEGAWMPSQFDNPANPEVHARTTGPEIIAALAPQVPSAFVAGVGTGGTITGVARAFQRAGLSTSCIAVEPASSPVLSGGEAGPTKLQGLGAGFVPANFDRSLVKHIAQVEDGEAHEMKQRLAHEEGLLVGLSAAANVIVACRVAATLPAEQSVCTVLCDTGERYFSLESHFVSC